MPTLKSTAIALVASFAAALGAFAAEPASPSSLIGVWAVDVSRLPMSPESRPRSVKMTFSLPGAERVQMKVEVIDPSGTRLEAEGITPLDGSPTPVKSNFEADVSATLMPRPDVLIMQLAKGGIPASTRIYTVDADGKTMVETVAHFTRDGKPVLRKNYFSKVN